MSMINQVAFEGEGPVFRGQVIDPGFGAQLLHEGVPAVVADQLAEADGFFGGSVGDGILVTIAEPVYTVWACRDAGGKFPVAEPVSTEEALRDGSLFLGDVGLDVIGNAHVLFGIAGFKPVENPRGIRTCGYTEPAADTPFIVYQYNAVLTLEGGIHGTYLGAGGIVAMHAGLGHVIGRRMVGILHLEDVDVVLFGAQLVVILTGRHALAGIAAFRQVNDHHPAFPLHAKAAPLLVFSERRHFCRRELGSIHFDQFTA